MTSIFMRALGLIKVLMVPSCSMTFIEHGRDSNCSSDNSKSLSGDINEKSKDDCSFEFIYSGKGLYSKHRCAVFVTDSEGDCLIFIVKFLTIRNILLICFYGLIALVFFRDVLSGNFQALWLIVFLISLLHCLSFFWMLPNMKGVKNRALELYCQSRRVRCVQ